MTGDARTDGPVRLALGGLGVLLAGYGVLLLLTRVPFGDLVEVAAWLGGAVLAHDALLAPAVLLVAWTLARLAPRWTHGPLVVGGLVLGTLTVLAVPVLGGWGRRADNPTLLDRDYVAGWWLVAGVVAAGVAAGLALSLLRRRGDRVPGGEDGQGAGGR